MQKQDALKSEMGINFSAQYASGSINYGQQHLTGSQTLAGHGVDASSLAWTARGGNSLLCAKCVNLPLSSVSTDPIVVRLAGPAVSQTPNIGELSRYVFHSVNQSKLSLLNQQEKVVTLHELIGRFEEWKTIPKLFEDIAQQRIQAGSRIKPPWRGKMRLTLGDRRLAWNDLDNFSLDVTDKPPDQGPKEPVFTVVSANINDQRPLPVLSSVSLHAWEQR
jgi:hypothetical protein